MNFYELLLPVTINIHYLDRYIKFLDYCRRQNTAITYTEKHHILPVSLFPEFKKEPENTIVVTARQHFLAHWMLAKLTKHPKMWFAFNQMRRLGNNSILYQYARIEIAKAISIANKGKIRSPEHMTAIKNSFVGKRPGRDISNNTVAWVYKDDPRWSTGELISPNTGNKHSVETKCKIGNANRGKKLYQNEQGQIKMFYPDNIPDGFFLYDNPAWHESTVKDTYWAYNVKTNKHARVSNDEDLPENFIKGRLNHQGFKNINNSNKAKYVDLYLKEYAFLNMSEVNKTRHVRFDGQSLDKIIILLYNNEVVIGIKYILEYLKEKNIFLSSDEIMSGTIKPAHHNNNPEIYSFRAKHQHKQLKEIGVLLYPLKNFQMLKKYKIKENK